METIEEHALSPRKGARYLGISEATLRLWRAQAKGPRFFRAGKLIRYRKADLDEWIEERLSTAAPQTSPAR
jgi:excisionase family DNA binding protein